MDSDRAPLLEAMELCDGDVDGADAQLSYPSQSPRAEATSVRGDFLHGLCGCHNDHRGCSLNRPGSDGGDGRRQTASKSSLGPDHVEEADFRASRPVRAQQQEKVRLCPTVTRDSVMLLLAVLLNFVLAFVLLVCLGLKNARHFKALQTGE